MKKKLLSLLTLFFIFVLSAQVGSLQAATAEDPGQTTIDQAFEGRELFKNFELYGLPTGDMPTEKYCDDCRKDCPFCPKYCWGADKLCNTCTASGNCPSNCHKCSLCPHCEPDGWCCKSIWHGGGSCSHKPATCS